MDWAEFLNKCSALDPYLSVEYAAEVHDRWLGGDTPEQAIDHAREVSTEFDEW